MKYSKWMAILVGSLVLIGCSEDSNRAADDAAPGDVGVDVRGQDDAAGDAGSGDTAPKADAGADAKSGADAQGDPDAGEGARHRATVAGCHIFPADNPWNQDISGLPEHPRAAAILAQMNPERALHPDWGKWSDDHYGIPWQSGAGAPEIPITWTASWGASESDLYPCAGGDFCYPIPADARIEGGPGADSGADRHVVYLDTAGAPDNCTLFELYNAQNYADGHWTAGNGAIFPLGTNDLRPDGWTSADAAGLPILPGLVRVEEVLAGEVPHAIRFTMQRSARAYIPPATHAAGRDGEDLPPMGLRVRLRANYPVDAAPSAARPILRAMQTYGLILADNGSDWFITGDSDDRWEPLMDDVIGGLRQVHGRDFEVVDTGPAIPQ